MTDLLDPARRVLHDVFGFGDFRPGPADVLRAVFDGDDAWRAAGAPAGEDPHYRHAAEQEVRATLDSWRGAER